MSGSQERKRARVVVEHALKRTRLWSEGDEMEKKEAKIEEENRAETRRIEAERKRQEAEEDRRLEKI